MLNRLFAVCLGVALVAVSPALGQAQQGSWTRSLGVGPSLPVGSLADEAKVGYHFQGSLAYERAGLPIAIRADLFYQLFRNVDREPSLYVSLGGEWFRQARGELSAVYSMPMGTLEPYALLGAGWGQEWHGDRSFNGTRHSNLSLNGGVGLDFPFLGRKGFLEARVTNVIDASALPLNPPAVQDQVNFRTIPITVGIRF